MTAPRNPGALRVRLYGKRGCHLCEQAEADLARLRRRYAHTLEVVDITQDPELMARYGLRIPVLVVAGREHDAPLECAEIEQALAQGRQSPPSAQVSEAIPHGP
jgi:hypothetical protein